MPAFAENPAAAVAGCDAHCREASAPCASEAKCPTESVPRRFPRLVTVGTPRLKQSRPELKPAAQGRLSPDITAERDEYGAVPRRPGAAETPVQELSHSVAIPDITAERDGYVSVPRRPGTAEAADQELSHSGAIPGITAKRDE